jgi:hypothetical protein
LLNTKVSAMNKSVADLRRNYSYGVPEIIQERDHPKQVSFEHDWAVMCSLDGDGQRVPEGETGQQVPAAQLLQGPKIQRDRADATPMQM